MIDGLNGLEARVRIFKGKKICPESKISNQSPLYTGDARHRMIQATTDERFEVQVVVTNNFDFKDQKYVRAKLDLDGDARTLSKHIANNSVRRRGKSDGNSVKYSLSTMKGWRDDECVCFGFGFGALEVVPDLVLNAGAEARQAQNRGTIKLTLQRGSAERTKEGAAFEDINLQPVPSLATSERIVVEHCKTHGLKYEPTASYAEITTT